MIFFDLDGTLYCTHETCFPPLYELCKQYDIPLSQEDAYYLLYTSTDAFLEKTAPHLSPAQRMDFKRTLSQREDAQIRESGRLFDGARELLEALHAAGVPLAVCSMSIAHHVDLVLGTCGIAQYFTHVLARVEGKTKGQVLCGFLYDQGIEAEDCVMIGDSITDWNAASDAGMPFVGAGHGYETKDIAHKAWLAEELSQLHDEIYLAPIYAKIEKMITGREGVTVIGINGVDTCGKTTFAVGLDSYLRRRGRAMQVLHMDDFHHPRAIRHRELSPEGYLNNTFETEKLAEILREIRTHPVDQAINVLDLDSDTYSKKIHICTGMRTIVLVEGVLLYRPPLQDLFDIKIFLEIDFDEVLCRASLRDSAKYGDTVLEQYQRRFIPAQEIYLHTFRPREHSDIVIDNRDVHRPRIYDLK